jgi:SAM-dependent methyltransferase
MTLPSAFDETHFPMSRAFIDRKRKEFIDTCLRRSDVICDIGNQGKSIPDLSGYQLITLDLTSETRPDIVADITTTNLQIPDGRFDAVLCTEVLEHVVDPFAAVREIRRITRPNGVIFFTTPLNARIHGPVPDCWRFTEFGLRVLLRDFDIVAFDKLNTPDRNLFPLHYSAIARRRELDAPETDPRSMRFSKVD